jgi:hypothetical protein
MSTARKPSSKKKGSHAQRSAPEPKARVSHRKHGKGDPRGADLTIKHPDAAGIDVGARVHYVAVPEGRAEQSVRSFGAYTSQLEALARLYPISERATGE